MKIGIDPRERSFSDFNVLPIRFGDNSSGKISCTFHRFKGDDCSKAQGELLEIAASAGFSAVRGAPVGILNWGFYGEFSCFPKKSFSETGTLMVENLINALSFTGMERYHFFRLLKISQATYIQHPDRPDRWWSYKDHLLVKCGVKKEWPESHKTGDLYPYPS
jgi:hypothetical protein